MAALSVRGVHKRFGPVEVLKGIDLTVENGEFAVLLGPSGCGKSTLLAVVAGLERPSAGTVEIGDRVVNDIEPKDRDIAMVFQSYALYPAMTVRRDIPFGMGRALVRDPLLFLFDEPLSNLDAKLRVDMRTEIKQLHQRIGTTIVYVTHDQIEAMTMASRIAVMDKGEIQQFDSPETVYNRPANLFVARFLGTPPMNTVPARLARDGDSLAAIVGAGQPGQTMLPLPTQTAVAARAYLDREVI